MAQLETRVESDISLLGDHEKLKERPSGSIKIRADSPSTGMVHYFPSRIDFVTIKNTEIGSDRSRVLSQAFRKDVLELTEPCSNRLCGAPASAHRLASSNTLSLAA